MKIHHLNCGCMCPIGGKLFPSVFPRKVICHCLLIETRSGLVLIDTGFARSVYENPRSMGLLYPFLGLQSSVDECAAEQIQALGYEIADVRHVIPTHLDNDHAGAVDEFPNATIHTAEEELNAALNPRGLVEAVRYRQFVQKNKSRWQVHSFKQGENWFGFEGARPIAGTDDKIILIPLYGHTRGHFGVAVQNEGKWLFHVGDAYYSGAELNQRKPVGLNFFQWLVHQNLHQAFENQRKLGELRDSKRQVQFFCAHDPNEFPEAAEAVK